MVDRGGDLSVVEQVAQAITQDIESGKLQQGDPIPSESTLMQRYGIARATARLAVARLRAAGLVRTYSGRGSFVATPPDEVSLPPGAVLTVSGTATVTVDGSSTEYPPGTVFTV